MESAKYVNSLLKTKVNRTLLPSCSSAVLTWLVIYTLFFRVICHNTRVPSLYDPHLLFSQLLSGDIMADKSEIT